MLFYYDFYTKHRVGLLFFALILKRNFKNCKYFRFWSLDTDAQIFCTMKFTLLQITTLAVVCSQQRWVNRGGIAEIREIDFGPGGDEWIIDKQISPTGEERILEKEIGPFGTERIIEEDINPRTGQEWIIDKEFSPFVQDRIIEKEFTFGGFGSNGGFGQGFGQNRFGQSAFGNPFGSNVFGANNNPRGFNQGLGQGALGNPFGQNFFWFKRSMGKQSRWFW